MEEMLTVRAVRIFRASLVSVGLSIVAAGFAADAPVPASPALPAPRSLEELRALLDAHVTQPRFESALWGVKVVSLRSGATLYEHQPGRLMSPASNSKLYAGALALDHFGSEYRISTPILATAAPDAGGRVGGHLIVSGQGDPSWKAATRRGDFWAIFEPFVAVLRRAGVRHVTGDLIADTTYFRGPAYGAGWVIDDLNDDYGAEFSAITLEDNYVDVRVVPAAEAGRPASFELLHPASGVTLHNRTRTVPAGGTRSLHARRTLGGSDVHVFGDVPIAGPEEILDVTVPQPARWFAAALQEALRRGGIRVEGTARAVAWPETSPVPASAVKLGEVVSPPLRELVSGFMKPSQNLETDLIFAHVGETLRPADAPEWRTTEQCAVTALGEFLRRHGLPADEVRFDEGSGLSRNNLASANATVALLRLMATHRDAPAFRDSLPIAGVDGTIRRRMKGTEAENNVRAKTGTLRWANTLSGYVTTAAGEPLAFSVMVNRAVVPPGKFARDDVDAIAVLLARFAGTTSER
jgi:D-alanyl-D-alanine carboxypeptidase/D-alanyl-D-alanine-endopeptidase (penicillin-binding protein 4)